MDYKERGQDTRTGRFLSMDFLTKSYPYLSPYQFAGNNPIVFIDRDGLEPAGDPSTLKRVSPLYFDPHGVMYAVHAKDIKTQKPRDFWIYASESPIENLQGHEYRYYLGNQKWAVFWDDVKVVKDFQRGMKELTNNTLMTFAATTSIPVLIEVGGSQVVYQGVRWFGKNYGTNLLKDAAKELLANRGDWRQIDIFDLGLGAATSKLGTIGKLLNIGVSSYADFNLQDGFKSGLDGSKGNGSMIQDLMFNSFKEVAGQIGDAGGLSDMAKDGIDVGIDQVKTEMNEQMDSQNSGSKASDGGADIGGSKLIKER